MKDEGLNIISEILYRTMTVGNGGYVADFGPVLFGKMLRYTAYNVNERKVVQSRFPSTAEMAKGIQLALYQVKCIEIMRKWNCLLDYNDLEEWFGTNRCCVPISLSRMLDKRIIKAITEL